VRANLVYRDFTHVGGGKMPDAKTMGRWGVVLGPQALKQIHERMVKIAQAKGVTTGMRVDTVPFRLRIRPRRRPPRRALRPRHPRMNPHRNHLDRWRRRAYEILDHGRRATVQCALPVTQSSRGTAVCEGYGFHSLPAVFSSERYFLPPP
jgi:hypothetical protein